MSDPHHPESSTSLPPVSRDAGESSGWGMMMPTLLTVGGGLALLWLLENQTGALSTTARKTRDTAEEWWHDAGDWAGDTSGRARHWLSDTGETVSERAGEWREGLGDSLVSLGAKAAGLAGVLKAVGSGSLSSGASRAAKLMAYKKLAEYAVSSARHLSQSAARNPRVQAASHRAREVGHEGAERVRDAYHVLRSGRRSLEPESSGIGSTALLGLTLLGAGLGAAYLFSPSYGAERRRNLSLRARAAARDAGDWASDVTHRAQDLAGRAADYLPDDELVGRVRERLSSVLTEGAERLRVMADEGRITLSGLTESARDAALRATQSIPGVRDVQIASDDRTEPQAPKQSKGKRNGR